MVDTRTADDIIPLRQRDDHILVGIVSGIDRSQRGAYTYTVDVQNAAGNTVTLSRVREAVPGYLEGIAGRLSIGSRVQIQRYSRTLWQIVGVFSDPSNYGPVGTEVDTSLETALAYVRVSDAQGSPGVRAGYNQPGGVSISTLNALRDELSLIHLTRSGLNAMRMSSDALRMSVNRLNTQGNQTAVELIPGGEDQYARVVAFNDRLYLQFSKRGDRGEMALMPTAVTVGDAPTIPAQSDMRVPLEVGKNDILSKLDPVSIVEGDITSGVQSALNQIINQINALLDKLYKSEVQFEHTDLGVPAAASSVPPANKLVNLKALSSPVIIGVALGNSVRLFWGTVADASQYRIRIEATTNSGASTHSEYLSDSAVLDLLPANVANNQALSLLLKPPRVRGFGASDETATSLKVFSDIPLELQEGTLASLLLNQSTNELLSLETVDKVYADSDIAIRSVIPAAASVVQWSSVSPIYTAWLVTISVTAVPDKLNEFTESPPVEGKILMVQVPEGYGEYLFVR